MMTHERYIQAVANVAIARLTDGAERAKAQAVKLVYGMGPAGVLGVTYFSRWAGATGKEPVPFVEVCANCQRDLRDVALTVIHELGHVIAPAGAGHGPEWRAACDRLGLRKARAVHASLLAMLAPDVRLTVAALPLPTDGAPKGPPMAPGIVMPPIKPCGAGKGTKGGKSFGTGSGSRLRLWECDCRPPVKVRVASDRFRARCDECRCAFHAKGV